LAELLDHVDEVVFDTLDGEIRLRVDLCVRPVMPCFGCPGVSELGNLKSLKIIHGLLVDRPRRFLGLQELGNLDVNHLLLVRVSRLLARGPITHER
jgi:hypothetical protein